MKRASYREAVAWIAETDSVDVDGNNDPELVSDLVTALLVADLFDVDPLKVGIDICHKRMQLGIIDRVVAS